MPPLEILGRKNEKQSTKVTVVLTDFDGNPAAPTSMTWRVDDLETGDEIKGDTAIATPTDTEELLLGVAEMSMNNPARAIEGRVVSIKAVYGPNDELLKSWVVEVVNLREI